MTKKLACLRDFKKSNLCVEVRTVEGVDYRFYIVITEASGNTFSLTDANEIAQGIIDQYSVVDFLNEVEEQDWELDADDIKHILNNDFDYIRKQYLSTIRGTS